MSVNALSTSQQIAALQPHRPPPPPPNGFQDSGTTAPSGSGASQGTGGTNPFQKLATDLQAALVSLQSSNTAATDPLATLKNNLQSVINGGRQAGSTPAMHHAHHQPTDAPPSATSAPKTIMADMMQALQAYISGPKDRSNTSMTA